MSRVYVITTVRGRHDHLRRQRRGLAHSTTAPVVHIVVGMGDDGAGVVASAVPGPPVHQVSVPAPPLQLALARNRGAAASAQHGASRDDLLVFLDVDCIPCPEFIEHYVQAAQARPRDLLCGPVAYLPETELADISDQRLRSLAAPHPARPAPAPGELKQDGDHALFWSLSFAVRRGLWEEIGGFDESFTGYGAEDTDFAQQARALGIDVCWVGGAEAFHQHHPVSDPPVEHVDDILANGRRFARKWGWWPMRGWLEAFQDQGLVRRNGDDWQRSSVIVASVPQSHVYIRHLQPTLHTESAVVRLPDPPSRSGNPPTGAPWWPPAMLDPEWIRRNEFDVFHLHFGFDGESPQRLAEVCDALDAKGVPLVYTVHDLQNPHHTDTALHEAQLNLLIRRAAQLITLSSRAAETIAERWGISAHVVPHPHVVELPLIEQYAENQRRDTEQFRLGIHLKSLRQNMSAIPVLKAAIQAVGEVPGGVLQVNVHHDVFDPSGARHDPALRDWLTAREDIDVRVHDYFTDAELYDYLSGLHASLLPYRFGTHSGWMEACHDLGTPVIAADVGCYASQGADFLYRWTGDDVDSLSLRAAVRAAADEPLDSPQRAAQRRRQRADQRERIAATHEQIYRLALEL